MVATASPQVRRILVAKGLRAFGDGFVSVLLPLYLLELGFGALDVGIIATATLLGSGLLTLAVGLRAHRFAWRTLLLAATALMAATGLGFAFVTAFWPLLGDRRRRHAESVERRCQRVPAARACRAVAPRRRQGAHRGVRALQPRRRAGRRRRRVRGRAAVHALRRDGAAAPGVAPGDVRAVQRARIARGAGLPRIAASERIGRAARSRRRSPNRRARSTRSRRYSVSTRSAAASSSSRWSRCGSISASASRWPRPAASSSGPASCRRCLSSRPCASPIASGSSTRWCSRTCRRISASC